MMKQYGIAILLAFILGACVNQSNQSVDEYQCDYVNVDSDKPPFLLELHRDIEDQEHIILTDKKDPIPMTRQESASGEKYIDVTGNFIYWIKGDEATLSHQDVVFINCSLVK